VRTPCNCRTGPSSNVSATRRLRSHRARRLRADRRLLLDRPLSHVGLLAILLSTTAMGWNVVYNLIFDRLWPVARVPRTLGIRALHALGFEGGLILAGVPLAAWLLNISLTQAFLLDIGFFLFFLPYAFAYNWAYDGLRALWVERKVARV
jgi:uncharacterized membrane protein